MFRSMSTLPMTLSLVASFMSAITLLGVPAEVESSVLTPICTFQYQIIIF